MDTLTMKNVTLFVLVALLMGSPLSGCGPESSSHNESHSSEHQQTKQQRETNEEHTRGVHLTSEQQNSLGIKVEKLSGGSASSTISRPASIMYNLDLVAKVGPRIEAKVVRVMKDLGNQVRQDEPIALMSSVELGKIKAEYLKLKAKLKTEQAHYKREQSLYEQDISSKAELLEAEAHFQEAKAKLNASVESLRLYGLPQNKISDIEAGGDQPLSHFYLRSPLEGVIQERDISPGQTIGPNETPIHVANLSNIWVMIDAYEQDIPSLKEGQPISLSVRSIPGQNFEGTTDWISYSLEKDTRTMLVRAIVENPNQQLRAGMFGTARISTGEEQNTAIIPVDAVQTINDESVVFVPGEENGHYRPVDVTLGNENEGVVEIAFGLKPGDEAVIAGAFDLKSALTAQTRSSAHSH